MLPINGLSERLVRMRIEQRHQRMVAHANAIQAFGNALELNGLSKDDVFSLSPETTGYHIVMQTPGGPARLSREHCEEYFTHLAGRRVDEGYISVLLLSKKNQVIDLSRMATPVTPFIENFFNPSLAAIQQEAQFQLYVTEARRDPEWYTRPPAFTLPHAWSGKPIDFKVSSAYFLERIRDERLVDMTRDGVRSTD